MGIALNETRKSHKQHPETYKKRNVEICIYDTRYAINDVVVASSGDVDRSICCSSIHILDDFILRVLHQKTKEAYNITIGQLRNHQKHRGVRKNNFL